MSRLGHFFIEKNRVSGQQINSSKLTRPQAGYFQTPSMESHRRLQDVAGGRDWPEKALSRIARNGDRPLFLAFFGFLSDFC